MVNFKLHYEAWIAHSVPLFPLRGFVHLWLSPFWGSGACQLSAERYSITA